MRSTLVSPQETRVGKSIAKFTTNKNIDHDLFLNQYFISQELVINN